MAKGKCGCAGLTPVLGVCTAGGKQGSELQKVVVPQVKTKHELFEPSM